jgi:acyl transferase domain-containing protein/thioesterase domain-containing protein/acyl carrier protein
MDENDIAIIGMAVRAPGARSLTEFWNNLLAGRESIETLSDEALLAAGEPPERLRHSHYVPRAAVLPDMEMFDAEFFGLSPKEAAIMDPQHRHFLECAWEAFENSTRMPDTFAGPVGVFAGCGMGSYFYFNVCSNRQLVDQVGMFLLRHTGNDKDFLSTRVSYLLDLKGPSINVQTACSTSLVAVHYACQSLLSGECDMALAGGVTIEFPHRRGYVYQDGEILSPDGHCRAFDHRAAGTVFGSAAATIVVRRLADAIRDGDPIHAVIKATAVNNDGSSKAGYLAPSVTGQAAAITEAQALAGVTADQIGYVECHGTGTYLGDPIEVEALTQAFRRGSTARGFCRIGSVKTNIGHTDTAAGVIGLIKAAMTVKTGLIPPTLNFDKPNPTINFAESPFVVNDTLFDWQPQNGRRIAAVNSLGVGGTNAHAIIQSPPSAGPVQRAGEHDDRPALLVLSARNKPSLDNAARRLADALESDPQLSLTDVSYTLLAGRKHFENRRIIPTSGRQDAIAICRDATSRRGSNRRALDGTPQAAFVFPGGGAQHAGMARALYRNEPRFRAVVDEGLGYLEAGTAQEIRNAWFAPTPELAAALQRPSIQLPAILIVEIAIARLWMDWGCKPSVLIGHSMGENAAACIAGVFSFRDAVKLVRFRGELFDEVSGGSMLSVALCEADLKTHLPPGLDTASVNAPELCVVSGPKADLHRFAAQLAERGIESQPVAIDIAAHSRMLEPILGRFEAFVRSLPLSAPSIPIVSNLTAGLLTADQARDPAYWAKHLRSTVRFAEGIGSIVDPDRVFIEVGPGKTLSSLIKAQGSVDQNQIINSLPHAEEEVADDIHLLGAFGAAWALGLPIDMARLRGEAPARRVALPAYAFRHQPYFIEPAAPSAQSAQNELPRRIEDLAEWGYAVTWTQSAPPVRIGVAPPRKRWLIFLDDAGLGQELSARLNGFGHQVVTVALGDSFRRIDEVSYVLCPEDGREGFDSLIGHLVSEGFAPDRIVNLWLYTADEGHRPGSSFFHRNQERGFYALFHLARALSQADMSHEIDLAVITNGMQRVGDEVVRYPAKSTVLGAVLVLPREYANLSARAIDLPYDEAGAVVSPTMRRSVLKGLVQAFGAGRRSMPDWFDLLWDDLTASPGNHPADMSSEIVAYRNGRRWQHGFDKFRLDAAEAGQTHFKTGGVYLITGGLGDLALLFARALAERFRARLVLVGRQKAPPREDAEARRTGRVARAIQAIEGAGGQAVYMQGDVTNIEEMKRVVAETEAVFGALDGVLHTAGVVKDNLVEMKTAVELEAVLAPKVYGTEVLNEALAGRKLDIVVLFSSTSAAIAPAGQIDYVAANAYLNAVAQSAAMSAHRRVLALQWGIWSEVGLAAREIGSSGRRNVSDAVVARPLIDLVHHRSDGSFCLELTCGPDSHWILDQHRLASGEAVWPGTGYIEMLIEAAREIGFTAGVELRQLSFLAPLYVPDGETRKIVMQLTPSGPGVLSATIESEVDDGTTQFHAEATIVDAAVPAVAALEVDGIRGRCHSASEDPTGGKLRSAQEAHLRFGPRWSVLTAVHHGAGEKLAELELAEDFSGDLEAGYLAHPALLDIATGFAMELIDGYEPADALWVPAGYGQIQYCGPLPQRILTWARIQPSQGLGADYATFDVVIAAADGSILLKANDFTIKRLGKSLVAAETASARPATGVRLRMQRGASGDPDDQSAPRQQLARLVAEGIRPAEGVEAFLRAIATDLPQLVVSSMDLHALMKPAPRSEPGAAQNGEFERPDSDVDYVEPAPGVEATLAGFWTQLLGVKKIGTNDNFFDLGGHSLIAVRLFRMIKAEYAVDFPISVLFEAPTIGQCAALLVQSGVAAVPCSTQDAGPPCPAVLKARYSHLVPMSAGPAPGGRPFFICAGMFGNILNLRHLALHIGQDRPVYGLQAKGLFGGEAPHETFEEMARDYIAELRTVQPVGPYSIGGFSGGGMVAYEMARQLETAGETVSAVILLDTPRPQRVVLSIVDRLVMKWQDARREKGFFVTNWIRSRVAWELERFRKRKGPDATTQDQFHNAAIEAAFLRALWAYQVDPTRTPCLLLRPNLDVHYKITAGRELSSVRTLLSKDNGWTPFIENLAIIEVPGNHDSMVLEPHVRVLADHVRFSLRRVEDTSQRILLERFR